MGQMNLSLQVRELRKKGRCRDSCLYSYLEKQRNERLGMNMKKVQK